METKTKGYNTYLIVVESEEADLTDDDIISATGGMGNTCAGDEHIDRVSLLNDIYTTTRMIGNDPGPKRVRRGTALHIITGDGYVSVKTVEKSENSVNK